MAFGWSPIEMKIGAAQWHRGGPATVAAVCIDLPWKEQSQDLFSYRLRTDGDGHLVVRGPRGRALAVIDRQSYRLLSSVRNP